MASSKKRWNGPWNVEMVAGSRMLKVVVAAPDGDFFGLARWDEDAVERFRVQVGDEIAVKLLRQFGSDLTQSIEDVITRREHLPGPCLVGCRHQKNTPTD